MLPEYEVFRYANLTVNKIGFITIDTAKYGLSPEFNGKIVQVKIYFDKIEVFYDRNLLKTFRRNYDKNDENFDWKDYMKTLIKKPGATEHTRFFEQMPKLWREYLKSADCKERKSALTILSEIIADENADICEDILQLATGYGTVESENIRQCYAWLSKPENNPKPLELLSKTPISNYQPDLSIYDNLTGGNTI
ncbi:hypothetical protein FACS189499_10640 [Clostridia bacterium]|nr:hypothetical protein FACS189499_10640 [Clostridia bacterium]